jgi:hypothetical protein
MNAPRTHLLEYLGAEDAALYTLAAVEHAQA